MLGEIISEAIDDTQALERIRPDLNIEKWSIWQPANSRNAPCERTFEREITLPDGSKLTAQVEISFTGKGTITTEDQKTYYALVKCWEDKGYPDEFTPISLRELAKLLKKKWGTNVIDSLVQSLRRLRVTPIAWRNSYYDSVTGETIEELTDFTILSELKIFRRRQGKTQYHGVGHFQFDRHVLTNLSNSYTKPLLFDTAISFKREIAQILYPHVDLVMADKYKYERRTEGLFDDLGLTGGAYRNKSNRKQRLEPALKEMEGKPLTTGVLTKAALEKTSDGTDYKVVFVKKAGRKKKSHNTQPLPSGESSTLAHGLYERGIKPESKAVALIGKNPAKLVKMWLEVYDCGVIKIGGLHDALEHGWQPSHEQLQTVTKATQQKDSKERNQKIAELEEAQKGIKEERHKARKQLLEEIMDDNPKVIEEAAAKIENLYVRGKVTECSSVREMYDQSPLVRSEIERVIREEMFRDRFDEVEKDFNERIEIIGKQIEGLKIGVR